MSLARVGLVSLGCPKNLVDGEAMLGLLAAAGYEATPDAGAADAIIVNTCGFIDSAKRESISAILDMAAKKGSGSCRALIVTGCLAERYRSEFAEQFPEVDFVLGVSECGGIVEAVRESLARAGWEGGGRRPAAASGLPCGGSDPRFSHLAARGAVTTGRGYAYLKIADGCDNRCSYCVIPSLRGAYADRPIADIVGEAQRIADRCGQPMEFVLVAQDTTRYGAGWQCPDGAAQSAAAQYAAAQSAVAQAAAAQSAVAQSIASPAAPRGAVAAAAGGGRLPDLMRALSRADGVRWIRVMYCYPSLVDERLAAEIAENPKALHYLDIPIQHASDAVLRRMGRRYGRGQLEAMVAALRRAVPDIVLRTTVMAGFPGETEAEFGELLGFLAQARFDRLGAFAYSREDGTPAAIMPGQLPGRVSRARRAMVLALQAPITAEKDALRVGQEHWAVVDGLSGKHGRGGCSGCSGLEYLARTYAEAPEVDGAIRLRSDAPLAVGAFTRVRISRVSVHGLMANVLY